MEPTNSNPAVKKVYDFIALHTENGAWRQGERLPSTTRLAEIIGVSPRSVTKAIALLKSEGVVGGLQRSHLFAGNDKRPLPPAPHREPSILQMKRAELERDIIAGVYANEARLPGYKGLQNRYGICYRSLKSILRSMVNDNALIAEGKSYAFPYSKQRAGHQRITFLTHNFQSMPLTALNRGQYRIFDLLEYECTRRGLQLKLEEIDTFNSSKRLSSLKDKANQPEDGFIVDVWWNSDAFFQDLMNTLLARLNALRKPVAILDENGDFSLPGQFCSNPNFQVFRIEGEKAGSRIARFLLGRGHCSVAFISPFHHSRWSKQRLSGIKAQFTVAGYEDAVQEIVRENVGMSREIALIFSDFDEQLIRRLLPSDKSSRDDPYELFTRLRKGFSANDFTHGDIKQMKRRLEIVKELDKKHLDDVEFGRVSGELFWAIEAYMAPKFLIPLFAKAQANSAATAWICANDEVALSALSYLHTNGVRVPGQISVAGFDNQPIKALEQRLTSFDFNAHGFVHHMLNFIARPPKSRGTYRHVPVEVEGIVMQRDTVGKVNAGDTGLSA